MPTPILLGLLRLMVFALDVVGPRLVLARKLIRETQDRHLMMQDDSFAGGPLQHTRGLRKNANIRSYVKNAPASSGANRLEGNAKSGQGLAVAGRQEQSQKVRIFAVPVAFEGI